MRCLGVVKRKLWWFSESFVNPINHQAWRSRYFCGITVVFHRFDRIARLKDFLYNILQNCLFNYCKYLSIFSNLSTTNQLMRRQDNQLSSLFRLVRKRIKIILTEKQRILCVYLAHSTSHTDIKTITINLIIIILANFPIRSSIPPFYL